MSNQLTAEQQRMIEENRRKALEKRALRLARTNSGDGQASLLSPKGASELANSKLANVQRATPAAVAAKQFVAPVKQFDSRVDAPVNHISHAANCAPNEVSSSAYSGQHEKKKTVKFKRVPMSHVFFSFFKISTKKKEYDKCCHLHEYLRNLRKWSLLKIVKTWLLLEWLRTQEVALVQEGCWSLLNSFIPFRLKAAAHFHKQDIHMGAAPLPPVKEEVEEVRRRFRRVAPLAHSTNSPVNQQQVLCLSLPPTHLPPAFYLQRSPPSPSEEGVWPTQKAASEWKWATMLSSLRRLNQSPQKTMVSTWCCYDSFIVVICFWNSGTSI